MSTIGKWGYSHDGETFSGDFDFPEDAEAVGRDQRGRRFCIGQYSAIDPPESYLDASLLIEHVLCQDQFNMECSLDSIEATDQQTEELTAAVQKLFGQWLDRHGLRPTFLLVDPSTIAEFGAKP